MFARYGIPEVLISDNGPQYSSEEFRQFATTWGFIHKTSSPTYPQSNDLAERTVQAVKNLLKKAKASGSCPFLSLLSYRNTPLQQNGTINES
jgi:transposase InsO family protein